MKTMRVIVLISLATFLFGCASFQAGNDISAGRQALLIGNSEAALSYFQRAAQRDPNYIYGATYRQGVWSYVGRAEYATGKLPQARQTLERALAANRDEYLARLYLGLTLAREGDRQNGLKEIEGGMKGIYDWLEYVTFTTRYGQFWDPRREIRSDIEKNLAMLSAKEVDLQRVITNGESLGTRMETEIDLAYRDEHTDMTTDGSGSAEPN
jgi:tetratricopeptide (TPR) repeat protein